MVPWPLGALAVGALASGGPIMALCPAMAPWLGGGALTGGALDDGGPVTGVMAHGVPADGGPVIGAAG